MGADIHCYLEQYNKETNQWESLNLYKKNENGGFDPLDVYDCRSYDLFGLLAGVRNAFAASSILGSSWGCLVEPRGLPDNLSSSAKEEWGDGEHWFNATWYDYCELELCERLLVDASDILRKKNVRISCLEREVDRLRNLDDEDYCYDLLDEAGGDSSCNVIDIFVGFMNCIKNVLDAYEIWYPKPNQIRIVMWFDN